MRDIGVSCDSEMTTAECYGKRKAVKLAYDHLMKPDYVELAHDHLRHYHKRCWHRGLRLAICHENRREIPCMAVATASNVACLMTP
jgi:hypothetical protein